MCMCAGGVPIICFVSHEVTKKNKCKSPSVNHSNCNLIGWEFSNKGKSLSIESDLPNKGKSLHLLPCLRALSRLQDIRGNQLSSFGVIEWYFMYSNRVIDGVEGTRKMYVLLPYHPKHLAVLRDLTLKNSLACTT